MVERSKMRDTKQLILDLIKEVTQDRYPLCWTSHETTLGDFSGRDSSIEVFNIPLGEELGFLLSIRSIRPEIISLLGSEYQFIFHNPEATKKYYSDLLTRI